MRPVLRFLSDDLIDRILDEAREILERVGVDAERLEHVCRIVGSHHSGGEIDTPEFRAVWDADWLVNLFHEEPRPEPEALRKAMQEAFGMIPSKARKDGPESEPQSIYDRHRNEIVAAYREVGDNLSRLEGTLKEQGIQCNRRWLGVYLERWGVRSVKRRK